jgi:amino acid transporter
MQMLFTFFFRLFLALVGAKLLARVVGLESLASLLILTLLFLANLYLFDYLDYRSRSPWRRGRAVREPSSPPPVPPSASEPPPES